VAGVPPWALRDPATQQALRGPAKVGQRVEIDFNGHWTPATVTNAGQPPAAGDALAPGSTVESPVKSPGGAAEAASPTYAAVGGQSLVEDEEEEVAPEAKSGGGGGGAEEGAEERDEEEDGFEEINTDNMGGLMSFEEFKDSLLRGIEVVKFNRRGVAAFRTLTLLGDHTLTWMSPKEAHDAKGEIKKKGNFDVRDLLAVRPGEAPDTDAKAGSGLCGTATLRLYSKKNADGAEMQATGHCLSLLFPGRSVDIGTDSRAHRDFLLNGFRLLAKRGPSGGELVEVTSTHNSRERCAFISSSSSLYLVVRTRVPLVHAE